jgi:iron transport multicopper oxidase
MYRVPDVLKVQQTGTYWYHSHNRGQYIDGLRGALVVRDPRPPFKYDEEITLTVSDWYQDQAPGLINYFQSKDNVLAHNGAEPIPNSALIQDTQNAKISVKPRKTYMIRLVNIGSFVGSYIKFEGHSMTIIEIDGIYTEPKTVDSLYITVAQRYSVLVTMKANASNNFAIMSTLDTAMFDSIPVWAKPDVFGYLVYDDKKPLPVPTPLRNNTPIDDLTIKPRDAEKCHDKVDRQIMMVMDFHEEDGVNRSVWAVGASKNYS